MKSLAILAGLACAAMASATYELLFAADSINKQVRRYDAITGTPLGSFGAGLFSGGRMAADPSSGLIYCSDLVSNRIVSFKYSTGEFAGAFPVTASYQCVLLNDGTLLTAAEGGFFYRYSKSGSLLTTYTMPAGTLSGLTQASNGYIYASTATGSLYRFGVSGGAGTLVTSLFSGWAIGIKAFGNTIAYTEFGDSGKTGLITVKADGTLLAAGPSVNLFVGEANSMLAREVAFGHSGLVYVLGDDTTAGKNYLYTWDPTMTTFARKLDLGIDGSYKCFGISTIVAPEPASMAALAVGSLMLFRRRRRS